MLMHLQDQRGCALDSAEREGNAGVKFHFGKHLRVNYPIWNLLTERGQSNVVLVFAK
jgi:hypothetical protein